VVFNTAIHACAGGGDWRHALELLEEMKKEGLSPDYHSYTAAMLACQRAGEWQTVLSLLQRMEALGFPITTEAYGVVMAACVRSKDWDQVPQVLLTMEAAGVSPDHQFVEVLMKQLAAEGQWRTAIKVGMQTHKNHRHIDTCTIKPHVQQPSIHHLSSHNPSLLTCNPCPSPPGVCR
jgi:pentatricopeptide repeat domain-containing protein 1